MLWKRKKKQIQILKTETNEETMSALLVARINFELFKSIFKKDPMISASKNGHGHVDEEKFKIVRMRESDSSGNVSKSIDSMRIKDTPHNREWMDMINRAYGVKAHTDKGYIYVNYDILTIDQDTYKEES